MKKKEQANTVKDLEWNVIHHDTNGDRIEIYNVFNHFRFAEEATAV